MANAFLVFDIYMIGDVQYADGSVLSWKQVASIQLGHNTHLT